MNCPSCGTPAAAGAAHCKRCGTPLGAKKGAAAAAVPDEYDLMPMEPVKEPAHSSFEPPANLPPPGPAALSKPAKDYSKPPEPDAPGTKIRGANAAPPKSNLNMIIGGVIAVLVLGFIGYRIFRTKNEIVPPGKPKVEIQVSLQPNATRVENVEVTGKVPYTLEVTVQDGEMLVAIFKRSPKDPSTLVVLKKLDEGFETVKKGDTHTLKGEFVAGQYSWVLANDTKKPARAKVKFVAVQ